MNTKLHDINGFCCNEDLVYCRYQSVCWQYIHHSTLIQVNPLLILSRHGKCNDTTSSCTWKGYQYRRKEKIPIKKSDKCLRSNMNNTRVRGCVVIKITDAHTDTHLLLFVCVYVFFYHHVIKKINICTHTHTHTHTFLWLVLI